MKDWIEEIVSARLAPNARKSSFGGNIEALPIDAFVRARVNGIMAKLFCALLLIACFVIARLFENIWRKNFVLIHAVLNGWWPTKNGALIQNRFANAAASQSAGQNIGAVAIAGVMAKKNTPEMASSMPTIAKSSRRMSSAPSAIVTNCG